MIKILVTGASGQIGSELTLELRRRYGGENVIAAFHSKKAPEELIASGPYEYIDVTKRTDLERVIREHNINVIYHLAAILSARGESDPQLAWNVNVNGLINVLEVAREYNVSRIFWPSSIAVFGPETPKYNAPQETIMIPRTIYGITKVAGELLINYYFNRYGLDVRSLRYPGIISSMTLPGGGSTDYAVEMFYFAVTKKHYVCFVKEDTTLPMMYMPDCIKAAIMLMETDPKKIKHRVYNVSAMSFSAGQLAAEIRKYIPDFKCEFKPDFRQEIVSTWPISVDDSVARQEWGWKPDYDLPAMVKDMIEKISRKIQKEV